MTEPAPSDNSNHRKMFLVLRWVVALFVLALLIHFIPVEPLRNALSRVPLTRFLAVLFRYYLALLVGVLNWHLVVNTAGAK